MWNALINRMDGDGIITARWSALAAATSTPQPAVRNRIRVLRDRGLLQRVREAHGGVAARYGVTDPGQPGQASVPGAAPEPDRRPQGDRDEARRLFDQHAGHIRTRQREQLLKLWDALIGSMDDDGIITANVPALAAATSTPRQTVRDRIGALRGSGLLQLVQEAHRGGAARYRVTDPGQPGQASVPGAAPEPDRRPQGSEDLSWLDRGDTSPMPGPAPAPPAGTGLPWLPGPLDDPDAPTASSWPAGWTEPGWPVSDIDVTAHGAAMSTDRGQPRIDDQAGEGSGNLGDWATWQGNPALDLFDPLPPAAWVGPPTAMDTETGPGPQPMDPPWAQTPPGPTSWSPPSGDQHSQFPGTQSFPPGPGVQDPAPQSPMPGPAGWVPDIGVPDGHGAAIPANFGPPPIDNQPDDGRRKLGDWATYQGPVMD
ncbi:winged helix-turn helix protein [Micromonospora olivasterospora]|uniref:Winged helix-turn helix protein n=1 Tax=Micromonospora olivasterospora TaxID=1880 RepID=A0A562IJS0_MICOL|nr:winged helix-turn helix protein [Micromonospora olivasterospora]